MAALYHRSSEKKRIATEFRRQEEEVIGSLCRLGNRPISPKTQLEQEKRIRREIANSNERRRMQSINAGFQSLRTLLPHHEGEKLSKAAILQHTAEYIYQLEQEKTRLLSQNCQLKRLVNSQINHDSDGSCSDSPLPKRKKIEPVESADEGIGNMSPPQSEPGIDEIKREMIELRLQLERERRMRMYLEDQLRKLDAQMYPGRIREITHQVQLQYQQGTEEDGLSLSPSLNLALDTGLDTSPPSQLSSEEVESLHEIPASELSPEHTVEAPEDLSGKTTNKLSTVDCIVKTEDVPADAAPVPETVTSTVSVDAPVIKSPSTPTPIAVPVVESLTPFQPLLYSASTSRQNLETIVEAIRHLEGDHLFQDDPEPTNPELRQLSLEERCIKTETKLSQSCLNGEFAFRHQIIQSAPVSQLRPGVIVSNHS